LKVSIGGRKRIANFSLAIPKDEDAWIEFNSGDWELKFNLLINHESDLEGVTRVSCEGAQDHAKLVFKNLPTVSPMAFSSPLEVAFELGSTIVLLAHGQMVDNVALLNLDFFSVERRND